MIEPIPADDFAQDGVYRFPFTALDDTPGGRNLGRIEWNVELIRSAELKDGRYPIEKLLVWAQQTRDERYQGKVFEIHCSTDGVMGHKLSRPGLAFTDHVWRVLFCEVHGMPVLTAYPHSNEDNALIIRATSSLGIDVEFER